jgi:hypothetical protein
MFMNPTRKLYLIAVSTAGILLLLGCLILYFNKIERVNRTCLSDCFFLGEKQEEDRMLNSDQGLGAFLA